MTCYISLRSVRDIIGYADYALSETRPTGHLNVRSLWDIRDI